MLFRTTSVLLINRSLLFKYSEAIQFSVSMRALTLKLSHNISVLTLCNALAIAQEIPLFTQILTHEYCNNRNWLMSLQSLKLAFFQLCQTTPVSLIERFLLLKYSLATIFVSTGALTLKPPRNISVHTRFVM